MRKRWFWHVGLVDRFYEDHLASDLAGGDLLRAKQMRELPLFRVAISGLRAVRPRAPRNAG